MDRPTKRGVVTCARLKRELGCCCEAQLIRLSKLNQLIPIRTMIPKFLARTWRHYCHVRQNASNQQNFIVLPSFREIFARKNHVLVPFPFPGTCFFHYSLIGSDALGTYFVTAQDFSVNLAMKGSAHKIYDKLRLVWPTKVVSRDPFAYFHFYHFGHIASF